MLESYWDTDTDIKPNKRRMDGECMGMCLSTTIYNNCFVVLFPESYRAYKSSEKVDQHRSTMEGDSKNSCISGRSTKAKESSDMNGGRQSGRGGWFWSIEMILNDVRDQWLSDGVTTMHEFITSVGAWLRWLRVGRPVSCLQSHEEAPEEWRSIFQIFVFCGWPAMWFQCVQIKVDSPTATKNLETKGYFNSKSLGGACGYGCFQTYQQIKLDLWTFWMIFVWN